MDTEKRMTKREMCNYIVNGGEITEEVKNWFIKEIEKLDKENEKARERAAKKKAENQPFIDAALEYLDGKEELVTASELKENVDIFESVQKASSTLRGLEKDKILESEEVKTKKGKVKGYKVREA
jgi:GTP-sensing pleiotropic transcriptional regulator CodY